MTPTERRDYILRLIEELGIALRNLRGRLSKGREASPEVIEETADAQTRLLGPLSATVPFLDADTAAGIIGDRRQVKLWVDFIRLEADAWRLQGEESHASRLEERARALEIAAGGLDSV